MKLFRFLKKGDRNSMAIVQFVTPNGEEKSCYFVIKVQGRVVFCSDIYESKKVARDKFDELKKVFTDYEIV